MSIGTWGRITTVQMGVLMLAGHPMFRLDPMPDGDEYKIAAIREGLTRLKRVTGLDFGYDLARWHAELLLGDGANNWGYRRRSETWPKVRRAVERAIKDPARERLVQEIVAADAGSV